jgi:flagellar M-ring protein FliF
LSNQPPGAAAAPLSAAGTSPQTPSAAASASTSSHKENTVNYEVDKTIRHTKSEVGAIKRLSVAVVVNHRRNVDKDGNVAFAPRTEPEMAQIGELVRQAMGFNKERGDTLNVLNTPFSVQEAEGGGVGAPSVWSTWIDELLTPHGLARVGLYALMILVCLYAWFGLLSPALRDLIRVGSRIEPTYGPGAAEAAVASPGRASGQPAYDADLRAVKDLARQDPRIVANVVKDWVGRNE